MPTPNSKPRPMADSPPFKLDDGSQVAVIGGGPAGSFFSHFLLDLAKRADMNIAVDIYDPKDFLRFGPIGCNHCGGIVSESLVQIMAAEGINIPETVAQRGIDAYVLHTDVDSVRIDTPLQEKRIAAMFRGGGPLGTSDATWEGFDGFLQNLTRDSGAKIIPEKVKAIDFDDTGRPVVTTRGDTSKTYDLLVGAVGVNSPFLKVIEKLDFGYRPPEITKTTICEFYMGQELAKRYFGDAMHVFLLNIPGLRFAALIPKGNFITLALLGEKIDKEFLDSFLKSPEVKKCFPPDWDLPKEYKCRCSSYINIRGALQPFADRVLLVGDCAASKLYKNGIGAAYVTAKAGATTAILHGISAGDFKQNYWPACKSINTDNAFGRIIFAITRQIQKSKFLKRGVLRVVAKESKKEGKHRHMSSVLWDTFTGSAPYRNIILRSMRPGFWLPFIWETIVGMLPFRKNGKGGKGQVISSNALGKVYRDGETIINQGDTGDCMYVIQSGKVRIMGVEGNRKIHLAVLEEGDFFGEMALFEKQVRSTTVCAIDETRILTIDKKTLLRRIHEDPSLAFRILQKMSSRIREMNCQLRDVQN
ncbi:MAG: cyclic nucleotide-binding domain-containing protein [Deltaproteobacteria bacterium]|nr:cyclic nucleotide-binding domain-containing protein [Deltaproteobacteria bacterium]